MIDPCQRRYYYCIAATGQLQCITTGSLSEAQALVGARWPDLRWINVEAVTECGAQLMAKIYS